MKIGNKNPLNYKFRNNLNNFYNLKIKTKLLEALIIFMTKQKSLKFNNFNLLGLNLLH